jgi:hypothetical protein
MRMPNQSIARRQTSEVVVQQHTPGQIVERTRAKAQEIQGVVTTGAQVYDETRRDLEAIVTRGGRSARHQRYVEERIAYMQTVFDDGMRTLVTGAVRDILTEGPTETVRTIYVPEPRKSLFQALTGR